MTEAITEAYAVRTGAAEPWRPVAATDGRSRIVAIAAGGADEQRTNNVADSFEERLDVDRPDSWKAAKLPRGQS